MLEWLGLENGREFDPSAYVPPRLNAYSLSLPV
jgi:hypothetical protein